MTLPHSPACDLLGSKLPLVLAGMGGVARSELVAAVTGAGGFGFLGMVREPPELIEREVTRLRELGHSRFGVNIIPASTDPALLERQVSTLVELAVPVVGTPPIRRGRAGREMSQSDTVPAALMVASPPSTATTSDTSASVPA